MEKLNEKCMMRVKYWLSDAGRAKKGQRKELALRRQSAEAVTKHEEPP
jgi:hypothetical protein